MRSTGQDTIAAIATAPGRGAVAIVRLSGPGAFVVADGVFRGREPLARAPSHTAHLGRAVGADDEELDKVLATVMRAPSSFTTENVVEFGCHGGPVAARSVLDACLAAGARLARPGEFTERAFLGGRLDLVQAEAVADIVAATTRRGLAAALGQLEGRLSSRLQDLRETLLSYRVEIESLVDFDEDDIAAPDTEGVAAHGTAARNAIAAILKDARLGAAVREGMSAVIVGRPNVGKSSLMNALLGRDRVIVTDEPGTTRDIVEETVDLHGVPVRLIDTAGWRETSHPAESAGVDRTRRAAAGADVLVFVADLASGWTKADAAIADDLEPERTLVVWNKSDLAPEREPPRTLDGVAGCVVVSALTGDAIETLGARIVAVGAGTGSETPSVTNARHIDALKRALAATDASLVSLRRGAPPEMAAVDVAEATDALGEITGETTPEDVLRGIFARFCVGK